MPAMYSSKFEFVDNDVVAVFITSFFKMVAGKFDFEVLYNRVIFCRIIFVPFTVLSNSAAVFHLCEW